MGECFWEKPYETVGVPKGTIYAQTFTPLWSHNLEKIRLWLSHPNWPTSVKVSIQYLNPDGTPTGTDIASVLISWEHVPYGAYTNTREREVSPVRMVKGTDYAFYVETEECHPTMAPHIRYKAPPSGYSRGHMIKSEDGGDTWDTTDHGAMHFAEFGDPPLSPVAYLPPIDHLAVDLPSQTHYNVNACTRVATTAPCTLQCVVTDNMPIPIMTSRIVRGVSIPCLDYFEFKKWRSYTQKEKGDSLYHTFKLGGLKKNRHYWYTFTAVADFQPTFSTSAIFWLVHPGGPPFTFTRRPNAPGDLCASRITGNGPPCPDHWQTVDDTTPDEEATQLVGLTINQWYEGDLYHIPAIPDYDRPIAKVQLTIRIKRRGGYAYVPLAKAGLKINGTEWWTGGIRDIPETYKNFHYHLTENPITGEEWTYADLIDPQIGIKLRRYYGVGWTAVSYCTQVYCKVHHQCKAYN